MKFLILSENSNGSWPYLYVRSLGPYELRRRIELAGHKAEVLEWFTYWTEQELKQAITHYFDEDECVIALSTPFNTSDVYKIKETLIWAKNKFKNLKIIHGGARIIDNNLTDVIDIFFLGRSMKIFDLWLRNLPVDQFIIKTSPIVLHDNNFNQNIDSPVLVKYRDNDFLTSKDIVGFEIGVGCKFNCTFCNYELRNSKITNLISSEELHDFFQDTYTRFGIENFYVADDTINESDEKLEIIAKAIENLNFKPKISAFARLDIIAAKPYQLELLSKIQFKSLFFGIESFNPEAARQIRKKGNVENLANALQKIKEVSPNTFTVGGIIIGLNKDNKESIYQAVNEVIEKKLLSSIEFYPLTLRETSITHKYDFVSDLDKNPSSYGYIVDGVMEFWQNNMSAPILSWKSDWTNYLDASNLSQQLTNYCKTANLIGIGHLEYSTLYSMGLIKNNIDLLNQVKIRNKADTLSRLLKTTYVKKKLNELIDK